MAIENDITKLLRSSHAASTADEALRLPVSALLGVSSGAASALGTLQIASVFDLAASRVFGVAARLVEVASDPSRAEARLGVVAADAVAMPAGVQVGALADQPLSILRGIADAAALSAALDVSTVRELAAWPPYLAAKAILAAAFFPEEAAGFDPEAPDDLLPKSGVYPTERVFYRRLVIDAVPPSDGARPLETSEAIDLTAALGAASGGFKRLATGALLSFSQSWYAQGLTLGQLLHSTSLAPGESTRIAMIDWSRRSSASASEQISETEQLSNTQTHSRAISEVTSATAKEFQFGASTSTTSSSTGQAGAALGFELGPIAFGGSASGSTTTTEAMSASSSFGSRDLAASYAQNINDRSQQNASSVRNRRASIVREVSQSEHEEISTRVVTNYNHMHALTVQYYEVVQAFRVTTQLEQAERCLFVPLKLLEFRDETVIERWREVLARAALSLKVQRQLTVEYGVVEVIPQTPRVTPGRIFVGTVLSSGSVLQPTNSLPTTPITPTTPTTPGTPTTPITPVPGGTITREVPVAAVVKPRPPLSSAPAILEAKGWNLEQLTTLGSASGRVLGRPGMDTVFISDDALLLGFVLRDSTALRFSVRKRDGAELAALDSSATGFSLREPTALKDLSAIALQHAGAGEVRTVLVLQLSIGGTAMPLDVPVALKPGGASSALQDVIKFGAAAAQKDLIDHLEANRLHYSQAVFRSLDAATLAAILAGFTYRGIPVSQLVDAQPLASTANYLVFKVNVSTTGDAEDPRWTAEQEAWRTWLQLRGLDRPAPRSEIIPLPSGGVFAEAVLGRFNSAEKIDLTRFWNWQDSPIPITAPEIAPVQAGSRAQSDEIRPGNLSAPVVTIQSPTSLPDPAGVGAILSAIQQGNMFRDMSGLAQTVALAQASQQASAAGATAAGQQAANTLATVMANNTERMRIAAQMLTGTGALGGGGQQPPGKGTVSERGGELNAAQAIGNQIDQSAAQPVGGGTSGEGGGGGEAGGSGGAVVPSGTPSPGTQLVADVFRQQFAAGGGARTPTIERFAQTLLDSTGGEDVLSFAKPGDGGGTKTGGGGAVKVQARKFKVTARFTVDGSDPLKIGGIEMTIYEGHLGDTVFSSKTKNAFLHGNVIKTKTVSVANEKVSILLYISPRFAQAEAANEIAKSFETFAYYAVDGRDIDIVCDAELAEREQTIDAADAAQAVELAKAKLPGDQRHFVIDQDETEISPGKFRVTLKHYTGVMKLGGTKPLRVIF